MTSSAVAKFKIRQNVLGSDSPNLMLAKGSCYTVFYIVWWVGVDVPEKIFKPHSQFSSSDAEYRRSIPIAFVFVSNSYYW